MARRRVAGSHRQGRVIGVKRPYASALITGFNPQRKCREPSFDDLVGGYQQAGRHRQTKRLRRFEIDDRFILGRRLHRKVGRLVAAQDAVDIGAACRNIST